MKFPKAVAALSLPIESTAPALQAFLFAALKGLLFPSPLFALPAAVEADD